MWIKFVKPVLYFIPLIVVQLVIVPLISIENIAPNLVLILVVYFTLREGQIFGTILGFIFGFLLDLISGGLLGAYMFSFTLGGFITGYFFNENKLDINLKSYFFLLILFVISLFSLFIFSAVSGSTSNIDILYILFAGGLLPAVYTTFFGVPIVVFSSKKGIL
jgi:rod shape-determining protein MreD